MQGRYPPESMSYLDSLLAAGERVVLRTRRHGIVPARMEILEGL